MVREYIPNVDFSRIPTHLDGEEIRGRWLLIELVPEQRVVWHGHTLDGMPDRKDDLRTVLTKHPLWKTEMRVRWEREYDPNEQGE